MMKQTPKKVQKQWGYELWLANNEENNYCGKILHVNSGHKLSMDRDWETITRIPIVFALFSEFA